MNRELFILEAVYTNGLTHIPVTRFVNDMVRDNRLNIYVNPPFIGISFNWDKIEVNHENFPSSTACDTPKYLTLIYLNSHGIHVINCPENDALCYENNHTQLRLWDHTKCILQKVVPLSWKEGMGFSDASPMHCHYHLIFPIVVYDKDSHETYRQKSESQDLEVHTVRPPVLLAILMPKPCRSSKVAFHAKRVPKKSPKPLNFTVILWITLLGHGPHAANFPLRPCA